MCLIGFPEGRWVGPEPGPPEAPAEGLFCPPAASGLLLPNGRTSHTISTSTTTRNAAKPRRKR